MFNLKYIYSNIVDIEKVPKTICLYSFARECNVLLVTSLYNITAIETTSDL
jgi:hypothetical protein